MERDDVRQHAQSLEIPYLVHFTRLDNLDSILQHGLLSVADIDLCGIQAVRNDSLRLDGRPAGISLSVAFPNSQMFYRYRMSLAGSEWAVLVIGPQVLWQKRCAYCRHNAADLRISNAPLDYLESYHGFTSLFEEIPGVTARTEQRLRPCDPTDVQAEVLVFESIRPEEIGAVVFESASARDRFAPILGGRSVYVHPSNKGLFASRSYVRR